MQVLNVKVVAACARKRAWFRRGDAKLAAKKIAHRERKPINFYRCPSCGGYHITSRTGKFYGGE